jgi:hypothetical protein
MENKPYSQDLAQSLARRPLTTVIHRHSRRFSAAVAATAVLASTLGLAGRANAASPAPPKPPAPRARPNTHPAFKAARTAVYNEADFGGYTAYPSNGVASASVSFKIPTITCTTNETEGLVLFGIETSYAAAVIEVYCDTPGPASYFYYMDTPSGTEAQPATAGDTVVASIFETSSITQAEIHDLTNGQFWLDNTTIDVGDAEASFGAFSNTAAGRVVPSFPKLSMSNAQVNGDYLGFESPVRYNDEGADTGHVVISTGALKTTASGSSFALTFKQGE